MKRVVWLALVGFALIADAYGHDTFLKLDDHFLDPDTTASVVLTNGTFESSLSNVALDRFRDARLTGPNGLHARPDKSQWTLTETTNELTFNTESSGTYGVGVSIKPRVLEMTAEAFERYLQNDGVLDVLEARRAADSSKQDVAERYSKHVKALIQVGGVLTDNVSEAYGYPIEIVPLENPFGLSVGDDLPVRVLFKGEPVANQSVYASHSGFAQRSDSDQHQEAVATRTDENGIATITLSQSGRWYIRLIHMVPVNEPDVDYESHWATLTFEIR
ncbi:MAG: DUF4198 domain-containing protein [Pseudomonadota bacterium]